jgi:hypothetical protein
MQLWKRSSLITVAIFASISIVLASSSSTTAIPDENTTYLAPLLEDCLPKKENKNCGNIEGKYLVLLREGYTRTSHLSYIAENLNIDPVRDWNIQWRDDEYYTANNVSPEFIDILRRDPGIEEIEQSYWFSMLELDICTNPSLSEEETRICYEEKDLRDCEKPSLSEEDRQSCYGFMKVLSCRGISENTDQFCSEFSRTDPCENSGLLEDERRFCRDGSLFATCTNLQNSLFQEGRRTCVRKLGSEKLKASSVNH